MSPATEWIFDAIKTATKPITHYDIAAFPNAPSYNTIKRITQELRRAGLVRAVVLTTETRTLREFGLRTAFVATVTSTGQSPSADEVDQAAADFSGN